MYSEERSVKSTGTVVRVLLRPWRMRIVVRVSSFRISWTSASGRTLVSRLAVSKTASAWDSGSGASLLPGANSSPPYLVTGKSGWCEPSRTSLNRASTRGQAE